MRARALEEQTRKWSLRTISFPIRFFVSNSCASPGLSGAGLGGVCSWSLFVVLRAVSRAVFGTWEYMTSLSPSQPLYENSWLDSFYIVKLDYESNYSLAHPGTYA